MNHMKLAGLALGVGMAMSASLAMADEPKSQSAGKPGAAGAAGAALDLNAPLPTDDRLVTGTLPNGLSYIVLQHPNPPGRANMYIHVSSGSLNETDKQRGIAHYLEHMAFNGSENFPPGTVVDFFQSMGLTFGQHQNAFTSFDQTTYILSFPDTKPETIERGMKFFSDVAFRLGLTQQEIDEERGIIFEEKRTREGGQQRMQDYVLERLIPGSLVGVRLPIGVAETLSSVNRPDFLDYYARWYAPSNMTVIVVADAEPKEIVSQIGKAFGGGEKKPRPVDQDPMIKPYEASRGVVATDPEQKRADLWVLRVGPKEPPITTVGAFRRDTVRNIGTSAFNRRIGARLAKGGTAYTSASASSQNLFNTAMANGVTVEGKPENWRPMLKEVGEELARARLHGFTAREIDDVKANIIASAEQYVEQERTMPAGRVIGGLNQAVATENTIVGAKNELDLYKRLLPTITPEEVSKMFAADFDMKNVTFVAQLPSEVPGGVPSEKDLVAAGRAALDVTPTAETESERPTMLMSGTPKPGVLSDVQTHAGSQVVSGWLDNGVRVHYRFMDIRKDEVTVSINLAAGSIMETAADRGISDVAELAWGQPATGTLTSTNIRDIMTGKKVRVRGGGGFGGMGGGRGGGGGGGGPDVMSLTISGSPGELEPGFQLAHLLLTDPVIEPSAFDRWKTQQLQFIEMRKNVIEAAAIEAMMKTNFPVSEARTQPLTVEQVNALSVPAAQKWLKSTIATAPIEVSVVGDIKQDEAMRLVSTYLGSIGKRERITSQTLDNLRTIKKEKGPKVTKLDVPTETKKVVVMNGFYSADAENVPDSRAMTAASRVISDRMRKQVREGEQLAYSPSVRHQAGEAYPGFGTFGIMTTTEPAKMDRLVELTSQIFKEFAASGPTDEEMETYRKQVANTLDEQMKSPEFWLGRTATMDYRKVSLDDVMGAPEFYQKITAEQIKAAFNKYYTPESVLQAIVKPAGEGAASPTGEKRSMSETP